jgi:hypothetical protein
MRVWNALTASHSVSDTSDLILKNQISCAALDIVDGAGEAMSFSDKRRELKGVSENSC